MLKHRLKWLLPVLIVAVAVLLGMAMKTLNSPPPKREKIQLSPVVDVLPIVYAPLKVTVSSQGTVSARRSIEWASEVAGRVVWVSPDFVEGRAVVAGTLLMRLDDTDFRLAVAQAEAALADAKLALEEERAEFRRGAVYRAESGQAAGDLRQPKLQQVEANYQAAEALLNQARRDLAATAIKAPFAGVITGKQADLGQYVATGAVLFSLHGTEVAEVRLPITAGDIGFIPIPLTGADSHTAVSLSATLGNDQRHWQGRVVRIEQRVDPETRTFHAVAEVAQPYSSQLHEAPLPLGLFVDARIDGVTVEHGVRLPRAAVHDNQYVFVVVDGHLQRREITPYRRERESVIVVDGLENGDQVVTSRLDLMVDGMAVSPVVATDARG